MPGIRQIKMLRKTKGRITVPLRNEQEKDKLFLQPSNCMVGGRTGDYLISKGRDQKEMTHRAVSSGSLVAWASGRVCFGRCRTDRRERLLPAVEVRYRCSSRHSGQSF